MRSPVTLAWIAFAALPACHDHGATPPASSPLANAPRAASPHAADVAHGTETPADTTPIPGLVPLSADDEALRLKCLAAKDAAMQGKSGADAFAAGTAAMDKVSRRCMDLGLAHQTMEQAQHKDRRAADEMRVIAAALAKTGATCDADGAPDPAVELGPCMMGAEEMRWDVPGWACVARALDDSQRSLFELGPAYVYSFHVDRARGTYEVVGHGCHMLLGGSASEVRTELVLRGKLGVPGDVARATVFRRAPSDAPSR